MVNLMARHQGASRVTLLQVDYVIAAVGQVARDGWRLLPQYKFNAATGARLEMLADCVHFQLFVSRPPGLSVGCLRFDVTHREKCVQRTTWQLLLRTCRCHKPCLTLAAAAC
jgi:hypothetical protein